MQKTRVFADTNVILEAFRTNCWKAISSHFAIETVEKCVEETLTGNPGDPRHISAKYSNPRPQDQNLAILVGMRTRVRFRVQPPNKPNVINTLGFFIDFR